MVAPSIPTPAIHSADFAQSMSARRLLVMGGIALVAVGMIFGDIFAVFVLHQNANRIGEHLQAATRAVAAGDANAAAEHWQRIGGLLENRGTKVDAHVHMIDFGYLALLLALAQPYVLLAEPKKRLLAKTLLWGAVLLPVGVFCIHYVGLKGSPFSAIGWASVVADFGGFLVIVALAGEAIGFLSFIKSGQPAPRDGFLSDRSWSSRALLSGGTLLVLLGFVYGAYFAGADLYRIESADKAALAAMIDGAGKKDLGAADVAIGSYGMLQAEKAVKIAAHAHIIEFGLLAMILAPLQPYVMLAEAWRRRWTVVLLAGSLILPVFVYMELRWGLLAGGIADLGGLRVVVALIGMLVGVVRYSGRVEAGGSA